MADIDVIAHLDLMKRYAIESIGNYRFSEFRAIIKEILQKAIDRSIGIQINTSGLSNQKVGESFPTLEIWKLYKSLGDEILTIGSDSHRVETVGSHLKDALLMVKEAGFQNVFTIEKRGVGRSKFKLPTTHW